MVDAATCARCGRRSVVMDSRVRDGDVRRRRECRRCDVRWTTVETVLTPEQPTRHRRVLGVGRRVRGSRTQLAASAALRALQERNEE